MAKRYYLLIVLVILTGPSVVAAAASGDTIRLNPDDVSAFVPSPLNDYQIALDGDALFVCWTAAVGPNTRIFLTRVNLDTGIAEKRIELSQGAGNFLAPSLLLREDQVEISWLEKLGKGRRLDYRIHFLSLLATDLSVGSTTALDFGRDLQPVQMVQAGGQAFAFGVSRKIGTTDKELRIYRKSKEGWGSVELPFGHASDMHTPALLDAGSEAILCWVRDRSLLLSRSHDGVNWSEPLVVVSEGVTSFYPLLERDDEKKTRLTLIWALEKMPSSFFASLTSEDAGLTWGEPVELGKISGTGIGWLHVENATDSRQMVYQFWNTEENCRTVESATFEAPFQRVRIDRTGAVCASSLSSWVYSDYSQNSQICAVWHVRRNVREGFYQNCTSGGVSEWQPVPRLLMKPDEGFAFASPKAFSFRGQLFVTFFSEIRPKRPFNQFATRGDLLLRRVAEPVPEGANEYSGGDAVHFIDERTVSNMGTPALRLN